jgi:hypothetical protein
MNDFFTSFWPNLASTMLGVVLALPIALWTNRLIVRHGELAQKNSGEERLAAALSVLVRAIGHNIVVLRRMRVEIENGRALFDAPVDFSAWDAVYSDMVLLRDPELQRQLAFYFSRMKAISKLSDMYLDFAAGITSALGGSESTRDSMKTHLLHQIDNLENKSIALIGQMASRLGVDPQIAMQNARAPHNEQPQ